MNISEIPMAVRTDSYKAGHFLQYPDAANIKKMVAYGEFRCGYPRMADNRITYYGIRYIVETVLNHQWTVAEVEKADKFFATHNAGFTPYPYPKDLFLKFIAENDGYFPVKVQSLPEGTIIYPHVPVYQITAEYPYAPLVTYLETLLTHVWYPTTVATLSRHVRTLIDTYFDKTVDPANFWKKDSRLHDFGYRGCTSEEQAILGGVAHLLNFTGSDTMAAAYYAQFHLNNGKPVANSIPATEHSVMTSYASEQEAVEQMMKMFGANPGVNQLGIFATVGDSYDYANFLNTIVPNVYEKFKGKFGLWVLRPDSGNPVECVMMGLQAAEKTFGVTINSKGYKVLNGAAVIQGDGIDIEVVHDILMAGEDLGFSVENIAFGMGGGLLQKVNRDTLSFATKLSQITYADGTVRDVMKQPKTDSGKTSLPGELMVVQAQGMPFVLPADPAREEQNILLTVYDNGPVVNEWKTFDQIKAAILDQYSKMPLDFNPITSELGTKIRTLTEIKALSEAVAQKAR